MQGAPDVALDEAEIIEYCKEHLAGYQVPKKIFIIASFPLTGTGKVKKAELRERYSEVFN